jgi:hypothetical protein
MNSLEMWIGLGALIACIFVGIIALSGERSDRQASKTAKGGQQHEKS